MGEVVLITIVVTVHVAIYLWVYSIACYKDGYKHGIEDGRLLERSQQDIAAGRVHDHEDVFAELDKELDNARTN